MQVSTWGPNSDLENGFVYNKAPEETQRKAVFELFNTMSMSARSIAKKEIFYSPFVLRIFFVDRG